MVRLNPSRVRQRKHASFVRGKGTSLGIDATSTMALIDRLDAGLAFSAIEHFHRVSRLPMATIAQIVRIPARTLGRRKHEGKLRPEESERLLRLASLFEQAMELFDGSIDLAARWLSRPQPALNGLTPLNMIRTEIGAREVEDLIGRLEHGVFT